MSVEGDALASNPRVWLATVGARRLYIEPGGPWENGHCEGFNGRLRDELLTGEIWPDCPVAPEQKSVSRSPFVRRAQDAKRQSSRKLKGPRHTEAAAAHYVIEGATVT